MLRMHVLRPPEYFAGLSFWALVVRCDRVILADSFQYSRQSFQNRARLRTPDGWQWITVPLKGGQRGCSIAEIEIDNTVPWRGKHLRALQYNYRSAPYFEAFEDRFEDLLEHEWTTLGDLTVASTSLVADILDLPRPERLSRVQAQPDESTELLLNSDPHQEGCPVLQFDGVQYHQNFPGFEAGMSILDAVFNLGFESIELLNRVGKLVE